MAAALNQSNATATSVNQNLPHISRSLTNRLLHGSGAGYKTIQGRTMHKNELKLWHDDSSLNTGHPLQGTMEGFIDRIVEHKYGKSSRHDRSEIISVVKICREAFSHAEDASSKGTEIHDHNVITRPPFETRTGGQAFDIALISVLPIYRYQSEKKLLTTLDESLSQPRESSPWDDSASGGE
uniref:Uncharacterized protein n=1 Tax=Kwoniella bestiolae CBS 10118 TaxID=1296100 RepID=A0A1B9GGU3_9TREE|nr:hypothetical protein I302_01789 [Kwoniella bestiolae CBS 10118]OCF30270.1 hypothetical protein I302_01789 [Kwoniella bestiolae CBS 10118]